MKKKVIFLTLAVIAAAALSACASTTAPAAASGEKELRTISVNGTGTVSLTPDMAIVQIGVQTEAADSQEAVAANNAAANLIMAAMSELGIEEGDLKTTNFSVYPRTRYDDNGEIIDVTYTVNNTVQVTVRQLDLLGDVLNEAVLAGANNIGGIQFDLSDREAAYTQAMEQAMANARARAEVLAGAGEVEIVGVQTINAYIGGGGIIARNTFAEAGIGGAQNVPVSSGEMEITVEVNVTFEIN
jgi:uncharacterized protein YggE